MSRWPLSSDDKTPKNLCTCRDIHTMTRLICNTLIIIMIDLLSIMRIPRHTCNDDVDDDDDDVDHDDDDHDDGGHDDDTDDGDLTNHYSPPAHEIDERFKGT